MTAMSATPHVTQQMADTSRPGTARMLAVHAMLAARLAAVLDSMPVLPAIQGLHSMQMDLAEYARQALEESIRIPQAVF